MLAGQDQEITILFCDIRSFSRITRRHGTALTLEWTNDVLSTLSDLVIRHDGVLVDYIGDGLLAMWGAPETQPDHARLACRSSLAMMAALPSLNDRWESALGEPTVVGIGINTGPAHVGNIGSRQKFKYGPLGDTVNVASRVQGSGRYLRSNLVITRPTRDRLDDTFRCRSLGRAQMINISDPIELFELCPTDRPNIAEICEAYEKAIAAFHAQDFDEAIRILCHLVSSYCDDGPSGSLLARALSARSAEPGSFDPIFRLPAK